MTQRNMSPKEDHQLTTERLALRPLQLSDQQWFFELNNSPFVRRFLWDNEAIDPSVAEDILKQSVESFAKEKFGLWKVTLNSDDRSIGYVGLWFFFDEPQPQLLYVVDEAFAGQGYAREASMEVVRYAFEDLDFSYLIAATDEPNEASQKLAEKLGFHLLEKQSIEGKPTLFLRKERKR